MKKEEKKAKNHNKKGKCSRAKIFQCPLLKFQHHYYLILHKLCRIIWTHFLLLHRSFGAKCAHLSGGKSGEGIVEKIVCGQLQGVTMGKFNGRLCSSEEKTKWKKVIIFDWNKLFFLSYSPIFPP